ncbi:MAG: gas vesicle protein [Leptodesmis sp.]|uniref:gas vesicle protein n=1 Tax=Leptodesmis sp. TaxID=3100501 RepID=UPI003D121F71
MTATQATKGFSTSALSTKDASRSIPTSTMGSSLADVLERVLDKGIVIAGDVSVSVANTELLNIRIRLLISSVDKAKEMGINWWENNPHFSAQTQNLLEANQQLLQRVESLEAELKSLRSLPASPSNLASSEVDDGTDLSLETWSQELLGL